MSVNKYKIRLEKGEKYLNIPLSLTTDTVGQSDVIEHNYVDKELEKAINPIIDHEKVRLKPIQDGKVVNRVDYSINVLENGSFPSVTTYGTEGFVNDDIKFKRNNFKRSFLNLSFFDSDSPTNQNYLGNLTLFSKINRFDLKGVIDQGPITEDDSTEESQEEFETPKSFGFIKATFDEGGSDSLFLGHSCLYISGFDPSIVRYYLDGTKWTSIRRGPDYFGGTIPDCETEGKIGTTVLSTEISEPLPWGAYQLVSTDYQYQNKTYSVYVKWAMNMWTKTQYVTDVYLVCTYDPSYVGNSGGGSSSGGYVPPTIEVGNVKDVADIPLKFIVEDPIKYPKGFAEGFHIYHEKMEVPNSIYMRGSFNNAKTGVSTDLITTKLPQNIDKVLSKLHVKYDLKKDGDIYYYELDTEYSDNIKVEGDRITIELYEIQVL
jgi:hypothetical protein